MQFKSIVYFPGQIIRMLTEKAKNQEAMIAEFEMREQEYQDLEAEMDMLRQQIEVTKYVLFSKMHRSTDLTWPLLVSMGR